MHQRVQMNRSKSSRELGLRFQEQHDLEELDNFSTNTNTLINESKLHALSKKQQEELQQAITNTQNNTTSSTSTSTVDSNTLKRQIERARQLDEADTLAKMMKVTQPNPVKMFACGSEVVCMLLQTGELYIWCDDDPHPKLMNGYLSPHVTQADQVRKNSIQTGEISDDHRVYWTEQELRIRSKEELTLLAERLGVQLYSRDEMLVRIKEKAEVDPSTVSDLFKGDPSLLPSTRLIEIGLTLGVLHEPSVERLIRAIIRHRLQDSVFVTHVSAGKHHFAACTAEASNNLWTWGLNDKGQLGLGDTKTREYPTQVVLPRPVKYCECGDRTTYCVTEGGEIYSWGMGESGQLGHTTRTASKRGSAKGNTGADGNAVNIVAENVSHPKKMVLMTQKSIALRKGNERKVGRNDDMKSSNSSGGNNETKGGGSEVPTAFTSASSGGSDIDSKGNANLHHPPRDDDRDHYAQSMHQQSQRTMMSNGRGSTTQDGDDEITSLLKSASAEGKAYLHIAAGGNQAAAWTTKYERLPGVTLEDHENLEQWKREAYEKFFRLKALRAINDELSRKHGFPDACPAHAEMVLCEPSSK